MKHYYGCMYPVEDCTCAGLVGATSPTLPKVAIQQARGGWVLHEDFGDAEVFSSFVDLIQRLAEIFNVGRRDRKGALSLVKGDG